MRKPFATTTFILSAIVGGFLVIAALGMLGSADWRDVVGLALLGVILLGAAIAYVLDERALARTERELNEAASEDERFRVRSQRLPDYD